MTPVTELTFWISGTAGSLLPLFIPNDTEANAAGRSGNARALRKQSKCGVIHEGEGHWPKFSQILQKARHL